MSCCPHRTTSALGPTWTKCSTRSSRPRSPRCPRGSSRALHGTGQNGDGQAESPDWAALLTGATVGERHDVACRIAGHFLRLLGVERAGEVEEILLGFGARCTPPFPEAEARGIVRDLAKKDRTRAPGAPTADTDRPLAVIGAGDFLAIEEPDPVAFIESILSDDGGGWLGGEEKLGKSWWAIEEAVCLAFGFPVCGRFAVPQRRRAMLLEEEDSPRRVRRRLRALLRGKGLDPDDPMVRAELNAWLRVSVWSGFTLDNPAMVAQLRAAITEFQPAVIYVDCVRKVTIRNLNHADEAGALLAILDDLRREFGCIFRLIHHYRKQQGFRTGRGSQEVAGSYVFGAWGENSLFFEPIGRKTGAVRVEVQSKDGAPVPAFRLRLESEGPTHAPTLVRLVAEDDAPDSGIDDLVAQVVATLPPTPAVTGRPGVAVNAIAEAVKKSDKTVRETLKRLIAAGRCLEVGTASRGLKLYGATE
jgi:AAA domain